jgi:hypothetical protein
MSPRDDATSGQPGASKLRNGADTHRKRASAASSVARLLAYIADTGGLNPAAKPRRRQRGDFRGRSTASPGDDAEQLCSGLTLSNVFCFWQPPGGFRQGADVAVEREASPRRLLVIGLHGGVLGAVDGTMHPAGATLSSHGVRRPLKASGAEAPAAQAAMMSASRREWAICAAPVVTDRRETTGIQKATPSACSSRVIEVRLRRLPPLNQLAPVRIQQLRRED